MATCPCNDEVELDVNPLEVEEGDIVSCPECGSSLTVISVSPLELELIDDDDLDDDDLDDDDEDEEDDDDWDEDDDEEDEDDDD